MSLPGIIPHLVVHDGNAAIEFYKAGLGAVEQMRMPGPGGKRLMHAALTVNGAVLYLCDDFPEHCNGAVKAPGTTKHDTAVTMHLAVPDCDAAMAKLAAAGGAVTMPAMDAFWGDRYGRVKDPFGHEWSFSTPLPADRAEAAKNSWKM